MSTKTIHAFWAAMASNDFSKAAAWLDPAFESYMPQSQEYLRGRDAFVAFNARYPAAGLWRFDVQRVVGSGDQMASDVVITDGAIQARAVTFHRLRAGRIWRQIEYWPDPFPAQEWRKDLVEIKETCPFAMEGPEVPRLP